MTISSFIKVLKEHNIKSFIQQMVMKKKAALTQMLSQTFVLRRLYREYVKKYLLYVIVAFVLMFVVSLTTSGIAYIIGPTINKVFVDKNKSSLYLSCIALVVLFFIKATSAYLQEVAVGIMSTRVQTDMRAKVFNKAIRMPMQDFERTPSGQATTMFFTDIQIVGNSSRELFITAIRDVAMVLCLIVVVFYNDWVLALLSIAVYPLVFVPLAKATKAANKQYLKGQNVLEILSGKITDIANGIKTIKSYNTEELETRRVKQHLIEFTRMMISMAKKIALASPAMELACGFSLSLIIFVGGLRVIYGYSDVGSFFSFFGALIMVHRPARSIAGIKIKTQICLGSLYRVFSYIDNIRTENLHKGEIVDMSNAKIKFENVNFNYIANNQPEGQENATLKNINFEIEPNTTVAFVGLSGSGKSTIVNLLMRLYEYNSGTISINGTDINAIEMAHLRRNIAYVGQDNFLFDSDVEENILYGLQKSQINQDKLYQVAEMSQINFLADYQNGLKERVGFNGNRFSGGQKQRIAIARAIMKDAPILIFDEATSALDAKTEHAIRDAVFNNLKDKTTIIIAHRLSTIVNCDKIYVMQDGAIVEEGTHKQLLEQNGLYQHLWNSLNDDSKAK